MPTTSTAPSVELPVPLVQATGTRFEVGYAHGSAVSELVSDTLEWSLRQIATAGIKRDEALEHAMTMLSFVETATPELVDELAGIAEGAGISVPEAAVINTRYELILAYGSAGGRTNGPECTIFGVEGSRMADGQPVIGQNVDLSAESRRLWILLDVTPDDAPRVATATLAGMLAQEGLNDAGLALCGSMVRCDGWRPGYPSRKFLRRKVLEQPSIDAAIRTIRAREGRASSHNLMLADKTGRVVDIETTVDDLAVLEPQGGVLVHSNHYVTSRFENENALLGGYVEHSCARRARLSELIEASQESLTVEALKDALRDHHNGGRAVCRHTARDDEGSETNLAIVTEPAAGRMHLAFGPPCETPFTTYFLTSAADRA